MNNRLIVAVAATLLNIAATSHNVLAAESTGAPSVNQNGTSSVPADTRAIPRAPTFTVHTGQVQFAPMTAPVDGSDGGGGAR
jgi:curli biogenesis system outer membrane secretion channel CsgG